MDNGFYNNYGNNTNYTNNYAPIPKKRNNGSVLIVGLFLIGIVVASFFFLSPKKNSTKIEIVPSELNLKKGDGYQLETKGGKDIVVYSSSNSDIVFVNETSGYILAKKEGTVTITASLKKDSSINATCEVTVGDSNIPGEVIIYTLTFDANGGSVSPTSIQLKYGNRFGKMPTPTRDGYKFIGWYTKKDGGSKVSENNKISKDTTIYAHWTKSGSTTPQTVTYTLTFDANGGSVTPSNRVLNKGSEYGTLPTPTRSGYKFDGWYTSKNGGSKVSENNKISKDTTIYAHWTKSGSTTPQTITYTLTFDANGGSVTPSNRVLNKGSEYGTLPTPTRSGYKFDGWYTSRDGGSKVSSSITINGNTIIYAHWTKNATPVTTYTLTFDANGGSVSPTSRKLDKGSKYGTLPTPTRSGYNFNGWFDLKDGGNRVNENTIINANTTIYAQWKVIETPSSGSSKIYFMNTCSSDAMIIESNGHYGLVDSSNPYRDGTAWSETNETCSVQHVINYLNSLGVKKLDFVIGTHSHSDHIGGMRVIAQKFVNSKTTYYYRAYEGTKEDTSTDWDNKGYYDRAVNEMKNYGAKLVEVTGKEPTITLGDFTIKIMNTSRAKSSEKENGVVVGENKNSIVQYITYKGKHKTLLAADMEREDEMDIANKLGHIEILKVGHHTCSSATSFPFANKLSPKVAVITNNGLLDTFYPVGYYMQSSLNTSFYLTGKAKDAVIIEYTDSKYTVTPSNAVTKFTVTKTSGNWKYINDKSWMLYKNGKPVYSEWYNDTDGSWYYMSILGTCQTGWAQLEWNGKYNWYYFKSDCRMVSNTCMTIDGKNFCFDASGACTSGSGC